MNEVNGAVITAAQGWRVLMSWDSLLGLFMLATSSGSKPLELGTAGDLEELWREKLQTMLTELVALEQAVDLISEGYFDEHDVLFADSRKELNSSYAAARLLILGYNCFAQENRREPIDTEAIERRPGRGIVKRVDEAKRQCAVLIDQSWELVDGTMRLIKQSQRLLLGGKRQAKEELQIRE